MWDALCQISRCALAHLISKSMLAIISAGSSGVIQLFTRASRQWVIACSLQARGSAIGLSITGKPQDVLSSENGTAALQAIGGPGRSTGGTSDPATRES